MNMKELNGSTRRHAPTRPAAAHRGTGGGRFGSTRLASIEFAADEDFLALARMATVHVAGLLGLPIGRVTDLRLAVNEGCALFAGTAADGAWLRRRPPERLAVCFDRYADQLEITISGPAPDRPPGEDDLGWIMLCALVGETRWRVVAGVGVLTLIEAIPAVP